MRYVSASLLVIALSCCATPEEVSADLLHQGLTNIGQPFFAGATLNYLPRQQAIPRRVFTDTDGTTPRDPLDVMADAGFNAIRVDTALGDCLVSPAFDNSSDVFAREINGQLDYGCIDKRVLLAKRARQRNMYVVLTLSMGARIPDAWLNYTYPQTVLAIDAEVKRQLTPFLLAGVQPDIILLERDGGHGMLYSVPEGSDGGTRNRGEPSPSVSAAQVQQELCGDVATGSVASWPKLAGYYKQEVLSARAAMTLALVDPSATRFGLHSEEVAFAWKNAMLYNTDPNAELLDAVLGCSLTNIIPVALTTTRADDALDIMAWSGPADPMAPSDPNSDPALQATLDALRANLTGLSTQIPAYGRYSSGPFNGQWRKQALVAAYASRFTAAQTPAQVRHTQMLFSLLKSYPWTLGALWWEPTQAFAAWENGEGALYTGAALDGNTVVRPKATLTTWGAAAVGSH